MKIGIQPTPIGFTNSWIEYCEKEKIDYKLVDSFRDDIIEQLTDCDAFMWDYDLILSKDNLVAKRLLFSLKQAGMVIFPSFNEVWHYDDKIGQKYLLEALQVPFIPTYIFYNKKKAKVWAKNTVYPKVFKLKGGAGSSNVKLVNSYFQASKLINKAFSTGFKPVNKAHYLKESYRKFKIREESLFSLFKHTIRYIIIPTDKEFIKQKERDYVYFQEFIPNNQSDTRVVVINQNKAVAIKRFNRKNDFRASGSGDFEFLDNENIRIDCLKLAFNTSKKLKMDSVGYDIVFDINNNPLIIEITYAYSGSIMNKCKGCWDDKLVWHESKVSVQHWMVDNIIEKLKKQKKL